ncbi:hypothetical protein PV702_27965 [Streptomyces sp. FL06-04B]|nr:hypothetical protein [Streptomyces sp. FL06-04B]MDX3610199.1 hypothetical protein [Streptomyces sp. FL06-04B]
MSSGTGITDADGRPVPITVTVGEHMPATAAADGPAPASMPHATIP